MIIYSSLITILFLIKQTLSANLISIISVEPPKAKALELVELTITIANPINYDSSNTIITIGVTELSCLMDDETNNLNCPVKFPVADVGEHNITLNDEDTGIVFNVEHPDSFSTIFYAYGTYYNTSVRQSFELKVDYTYNIEIAKINLVKDNNVNESLSDCEKGKNEDYIICYGTLIEPGLYVFYVNSKLQQQNGTNVSIIVYSDPFEIGSINDIDPSEMLINDLNQTFTITVDFSVNIENSVIYLLEQTTNKKIKLGNCIDDALDDITIYCYGIVNSPGVYSVILNGVEQDVTVYVYDVSLSYAFSITPQIVKWNPPSFETYVTIKFDSNIAHTTKSIQLRPSNSNFRNAEMTIEKRLNYVYIQYLVEFYNEDTYNLYIDDEQQEGVSITVTSESLTSKILSIYPNKVITDDYVYYIIEVDKILGIDQVNLQLVRDTSNDPDNSLYYEYTFDNCKNINDTFVKCRGYTKYKGDYNILIDGVIQEGLTINSKDYPSITSRVPKHARNSTYKQSLTLIFERNISEYRNNITLVSEYYKFNAFCRVVNETSDKRIICSFRIYNEGTYQICIDGYTAQEYLYVSSNIDVDSSEKGKFLKFSILYFILILFIFF